MKPKSILAPVYHDIFKAVKDFKAFRRGENYQIIGLDKFINGRASVYDIRGIKGNCQRFLVKRLTIEDLYEQGIIS
jgi:hypothetical protein